MSTTAAGVGAARVLRAGLRADRALDPGQRAGLRACWSWRCDVALGRAVGGGALGAVPGALLLVVNQAVVAGEAQLTIGVLALGLLVSGAVAGAVLGASGRLPVGPTALGAAVGALPGLLTVLVLPSAALVLLVVGTLVGGFLGARFARDAGEE